MISLIKWIIFILLFTAFIITFISIIYKQFTQWCSTNLNDLQFVFNCYDSVSNKSIDTFYLKNNIEIDAVLGDYYIMGSAKSYQIGGNTGSIPSIDSIIQNIKKGCRVIELDVHSSTNNIPIVKGLISSVCIDKPLEFKKCCEIVNKYGFKNNYPMILLLNLYTNNTTCLDNMATIIKKIFTNKLLNSKYGNNNINPFSININDCLDKIIFIFDISNSNITDTTLTPSDNLNNYINGFINISKNIKTSNLEINIINMSENSSLLSSYQSSNKINSTNTLNELLEFNKNNLTICKPKVIDSITNEIIQKDDLFNYDTYQSRLFGCQICLLYFNKYDSYLHNYINFFNEKPFILKPSCLRYEPEKLPKLIKQKKDLSYSTRKLKKIAGANNLPFNKNYMF